MAVKFGTDGWRALIGQDFTFSAAGRVAAALAALARRRGTSAAGVVVGYDRRFLSAECATHCAAVLARRGVPVWLCHSWCPTPALSFSVRRLGAAFGLMVTASHNPYLYNGLKLRGPSGSPLPAVEERLIEELVSAPGRSPAVCRAAVLAVGAPRGPGPSAEAGGLVGAGRPASAVAPSGIALLDPWPAYRQHVASLVDLAAIRAAGLTVVHDAMHGSAAGWIGRLLPGTATIHGGGDPRFGGLNPEPLPSNLSGLRRRVLASPRPAIGLATDGDGDRLAAVADDGRVVDAHHLLALIYMHLLELRLLRGGAVRTVTTSGLVDRVAAAHGLTVDVTPVGFRHVAGRLGPAAEPGALIGGEESGGLGLALHIPERDAVFASLVLLEHLAMSGRSLGEAVDRLEERFGRVVLGRLDLHCRTGLAERLERACPVPSSLAGVAVSGAERLDGLTIRLADGGRLHVRASHTEPVLRLYAEARAPEGMRALLEAGRALVRAGGRGPRGGCAP